MIGALSAADVALSRAPSALAAPVTPRTMRCPVSRAVVGQWRGAMAAEYASLDAGAPFAAVLAHAAAGAVGAVAHDDGPASSAPTWPAPMGGSFDHQGWIDADPVSGRSGA